MLAREFGRAMKKKRLLPPTGLEASIPKGLTAAQRIALWVDLVDSTEELVKAGLRQRLLPGQTLEMAFRQWHEAQHEEHVRALICMQQGIEVMAANHARRKATQDT
jgi:hypothetical protein